MRASYGEIKIQEILEENGLSFKMEYIFPDLRSPNGKPLRFDFAVFDDDGRIDFLIEYQGKQHYSCQNAGWDDPEQFEITQRHDRIKRDYCLTNGINLVIISYKENLQQRLEELFK